MYRSIVSAAQRLASDHGRFIVALLGSVCVKHDQPFDDDTANELYMDLYESASFDVLVPKPEEPTQNYMRNPRAPIPISDSATTDDKMGALLAGVAIHGLKLQLPGVNELLLQKLKISANAVPVLHPETTYLPFVQGLLTEFAGREPEDAVRLTISKVVTNVLVDLIAHAVPKQPSASANWSRPGVSCSCRDCQELNTFLRSSTQSVGRFPLGKMRRLHLHQKLDGSRRDCTHETERRGNPQTLVVTKINVTALAASAWTARVQQVAAKIRELPQDLLKQAAGEQYERILNSWDVVSDWSWAPAPLQRPPLRDLFLNAATPENAEGMRKRKADDLEPPPAVPKRRRAPMVIDLCDSD